jgi:uncharacterized protein
MLKSAHSDSFSLSEPLMTVSNPRAPLRLNVGFIVHQGIGYSREFDFDLPKLALPPDHELRDMTGTARITRTPQGLLSLVKMRATLYTDCARCLTTIPQPLDIDFTELFAFAQRFATESGLILPDDGNIDLEPLVREYMLLEVPLNPLCKPDCNGLCPVCGGNLNEEVCDHDAEVFVPRLAALKILLKK